MQFSTITTKFKTIADFDPYLQHRPFDHDMYLGRANNLVNMLCDAAFKIF